MWPFTIDNPNTVTEINKIFGKYKDKEVTVQYSGGMDSLMMVVGMMVVGAKMTVLTIDSRQLPNYNNDNKLKKEVLRLLGLHPDSLEMNGHHNSYRNGQMGLWLAAIAMRAVPDNIYMIGYVNGDEAISWIPDIKRAVKAMDFNRHGNIKVGFPLKKVHKHLINSILENIHYDGVPLTLLSNSCEKLFGTYTGHTQFSCGQCPSCIRNGTMAVGFSVASFRKYSNDMLNKAYRLLYGDEGHRVRALFVKESDMVYYGTEVDGVFKHQVCVPMSVSRPVDYTEINIEDVWTDESDSYDESTYLRMMEDITERYAPFGDEQGIQHISKILKLIDEVKDKMSAKKNSNTEVTVDEIPTLSTGT